MKVSKILNAVPTAESLISTIFHWYMLGSATILVIAMIIQWLIQ